MVYAMGVFVSVKNLVIIILIFGAGLGAGHFLFAAEDKGTSKPDLATQNVASVGGVNAAVDEAAVRRIVEAYIKENPTVIMQSVNDFQQNGQVNQLEARAEPYLAALQETAGSGIIGDVDAEVKIIEFFDYQCPHCKANYGVLQRLLAEDKTIALMPKFLPILGDGSENDMSLYAARAAEAARMQGQFAPFHEALMQSKLPLSRAGVQQIAASVGLDVERLKLDIAGEQVAKVVAQSRAIADEIGVSAAGTPAYIIGGKVMIGAAPDSYERLKAMVEAARHSD